jgi:ABC-2 type transport system permease protein
MPGWMRTLAALNPVAHAADALRGNVLGTATFGDSVAALAAAAALWALVTIVPRRTGNRDSAATASAASAQDGAEQGLDSPQPHVDPVGR